MRPPDLARAVFLAAPAFLLASTPAGTGAASALSPIVCSANCPPGTRLASFSTETLNEGLRGGWFVYTEGQCEATCAPIEECLPPNLPLVTDAGFTCRTAPGLSDIQRDAEVDFAFAARWDAARARVEP